MIFERVRIGGQYFNEISISVEKVLEQEKHLFALQQTSEFLIVGGIFVIEISIFGRKKNPCCQC